MQIVKIKLPDFSYAASTYYTLASSEAATNLARYDGIRYGGEDIEQWERHVRIHAGGSMGDCV